MLSPSNSLDALIQAHLDLQQCKTLISHSVCSENSRYFVSNGLDCECQSGAGVEMTCVKSKRSVAFLDAGVCQRPPACVCMNVCMDACPPQTSRLICILMTRTCLTGGNAAGRVYSHPVITESNDSTVNFARGTQRSRCTFITGQTWTL